MKFNRIIAIDPGTTHTGLVYMDRERVIDTKTLNYRESCGVDNNLLADRTNDIVNKVCEFIEQHAEYDTIVIEGFVPYAGLHTVAKSTSHQTPWLCGALIDRFMEYHLPYVIQTSAQVLNPKRKGNVSMQYDMLKNRKQTYFVYTGQEYLKNDHLRTAFLHGYYFLDRGLGKENAQRR